MRIPEEILAQAKTIAVVGLSPDTRRESYTVAVYLQQQGYKIIPVNPTAASVLGETCYRTLRDVPVAVDLVDVFRRAEFTPAVARDAVAIHAGAFWLQSGIVSEEAAKIAREGGLDVVMDACTKVVHMRAAASRADRVEVIRPW